MNRTLSGVILALTVAVLLFPPALASDAPPTLRTFTPRSLAEIRQAQTGRPFILAFWSVSCEPCREEMMIVTELHRKHPELPIYLIAADPPALRSQVQAFLASRSLGRIETWQFGDDSPERLRYSVDKTWPGELPRAYLFDAAHQPQAHSGVLHPEELEAWIKANPLPARR